MRHHIISYAAIASRFNEAVGSTRARFAPVRLATVRITTPSRF